MIYSNKYEKGQAIVYLVVGFVVFLGFVALAIDGGMALADRRHSQNAADSSSLAGGANASLILETFGVDYKNWSCNLSGVNSAMAYAEDTAITRASANNFSIDYDPSDHNGVVASCGHTDYPWYGNKGDVYIDVTVDISDTTQSNFLQLLFPSALHNEVDAVTRVRPRQPVAFGNAIVALNPGSCLGHGYGGIMYGNGNIDLFGGGVFSNGCLRGNGTADVDITDGLPLGNQLDPGNVDWNPPPELVDFQIPDSAYEVPIPNCTGHWVDDLPKMPTEATGLYCINDDLKINAGDVISSTNGVTIFVPHGKVIINGTPFIKLAAPLPDPDPSPAIPGVLLYLPASNPNSVTLNGTEDSIFEGLILAPRSRIELNGTGGNSYVGQVVGWNVLVGGTADFKLTYDGDKVYNKPTFIELAK
jgi:hypothetical protein